MRMKTMEVIKQLLEELNQAFVEHKTINDQPLIEIQKKGLGYCRLKRSNFFLQTVTRMEVTG